ncbi:MAG: hypothetical protein RLZZ301_228 [Bacteroidota bacterium]|jgi:hypothetical protein
MESNKSTEFQNPIDPNKVAEKPNLLPYAHQVGSALIKPEDQGKLKGRALSAMEQQTDMQLEQLYEQMQLLAAQAKKIQERKAISSILYQADMRFEPLINHIYHLYQKEAGGYLLSLIGPTQWGRSTPNLEFMASIRLLADHTWDILEKNEAFELNV